MVDHRQALASNLRDLRLQNGLSLANLARATGISSSFLSLVEQGRSEITIGRLIRLANFYEVELSDLLASSQATLTGNVQVLRADSSTLLHSEQEGVDLYDLSRGTQWGIVAALGVHKPGGSVQIDEALGREALVFVLEGTFELVFEDGHATRLQRGEGAIYLSAVPYRCTNVGRGTGQLLAVGIRSEQHRRSSA